MNPLRRRSLAFQLNVMILGGVTVVLALILILNYQTGRRLLVDKIEENAFNLARSTANRLDVRLQAAARIPLQTATMLESVPLTRENLRKLLAAQLKANPDIYGIAVAFAPDSRQGREKLNSCYFVRPGERIEERQIKYDYRFHDWYQIPRLLGRPVWSEPYFGRAGGIIMTSCSVPFYHRSSAGGRYFAGIVCIDLNLNRLRNIVASLKIGRTGYAFLITRNGTFVTHPRAGLVMNESIFSIADELHSPGLRALGRRMIAGETGFTAYRGLLNHQDNWMVYTPLKANGWVLGAIFPQQELMADLVRLNRKIVLLAGGGFLLVFLVIFIVSRQTVGPVKALTTATEQIAAGQFETPLPAVIDDHEEPGANEIIRLARTFAKMQQSLKEYIENLRITTAARERIASELNIAAEIQRGILPGTFPPFPEHREFSLYAMLKPAREVGGDLYDFFMLDDSHLCFTVGDVSGKGVAAALFMAITQTLVKTRSGPDPGAVLNRVNNDLAEDNPSMMFVTLFLGILNFKTGELVYSNGGHNPPYLLAPDRQERPAAPLPGTDGIALGVVEDFHFASRQIKLEKGEVLFVFTDGVTEAMNPQLELYDDERLEKALSSLAGAEPESITTAIMEELTVFAAGAEQADDITMLAIKWTAS